MDSAGSRARPPHWLAAFVQTTLRSFGLHLSRWPPQSTVERHLLDLFQLLDINCVLDVGANRGTYATALREIGYAGRIVSFEPSSASYRELCRTMQADRNWTGCQVALGDEEGTGDLQISRLSEFNSLHGVSEYGAVSRYSDHLHFIGSEQVVIRRLDALLEEVTAGIEAPRIFMKVDTQGHDLAVVRGAGEMLHRIPALQVELAARQLYRDVPPLSETIAEYERMGYLPRGFVPVTTERNGLVVIEWDCFLVRGAAA